jgi:glycosyltransferase involved in cell wall biosynthesis
LSRHAAVDLHPTISRADFIGEMLDCILAQMRDDVEVVIVDGGSAYS